MPKPEPSQVAFPWDLLRCPETGQRLASPSDATPELIATLESQRTAGILRFAGDHPQFNDSEPITGALIREDRQIGYPIQKGVPLLLPGYGIML